VCVGGGGGGSLSGFVQRQGCWQMVWHLAPHQDAQNFNPLNTAGRKRQSSPRAAPILESSLAQIEALAREASLMSTTFGMPSFLPPVRAAPGDLSPFASF